MTSKAQEESQRRMLKNNILEESLIKKTVLDFEFDKENIVVFEEEKLSVYHQDKNMFRRQPSNIIIVK